MNYWGQNKPKLPLRLFKGCFKSFQLYSYQSSVGERVSTPDGLSVYNILSKNFTTENKGTQQILISAYKYFQAFQTGQY